MDAERLLDLVESHVVLGFERRLFWEKISLHSLQAANSVRWGRSERNGSSGLMSRQLAVLAWNLA